MRPLRHAPRTLVPLIAFLAVAAFLVLPDTAALANPNITSSGPLTNIFTSSDLNCQVHRTGDSAGEFYENSEGSSTPACATLVALGNTLYGPAGIDAGGNATPRTPFTPVSQTSGGTGASGDPFTTTTVVDAGNLEITQTDSYFTGDDFYTTDVTIANTSDSAAEGSGVLYRAGDCYLGGADQGLGVENPDQGSIACAQEVGSQVLQWTPLTTGSSYFEGTFDALWAAVGTTDLFPNTCDCATLEDNGAGLSWGFAVAPGDHATFSETLTIGAPDNGCSPSASAPGKPTDVVAYPGDSSAALSWTAPVDNGGAQIDSYTVNVYDLSGGTEAPTHNAPAAETVQITGTNAQVDGLINGDTYEFTVQATNCAGTGSESTASNQITPAAGSSAVVIGPGNLSQSTSESGGKFPTPGDSTIGVQQFPPGTTGVGTLQELDPTGGGGLGTRAAASLSQFCGTQACIGNILEAKLHDGALGGPFYKLKLFLDRTLVRHLRTNVQVWYDGDLSDDNNNPDLTPPTTLSFCSGRFNGPPCIYRISRISGYDLKVVIKTPDIDPRLSTSR